MNGKLRIRIPKALYESVKKQQLLEEAAKSKVKVKLKTK